MKLWILRPLDDQIERIWNPPYDKNFGFVIRAETEEQARTIASQPGLLADESHEAYGESPWKFEHLTSCIELMPEGNSGLIMKDFHAG